MRAEGTCTAGGPWQGTHVPLPTRPRPNRTRPQRAPVIVLQPLTRGEERALVAGVEKRAKLARTYTPRREAAFHRIDGEEQAAMVKEYAAGDSLKDIGRRHGRHPKSVSDALIRAGVTIRPQGYRKPGPRLERRVDDQQVRELRDAGLTLHQIAAAMGIGRTTVGVSLRRSETARAVTGGRVSRRRAG